MKKTKQIIRFIHTLGTINSETNYALPTNIRTGDTWLEFRITTDLITLLFTVEEGEPIGYARTTDSSDYYPIDSDEFYRLLRAAAEYVK